MIADLRADSQRWRQEQRSTGTRGSHSPVMLEKSGCTVPDACVGPYENSSTYHQSSAGRVQRRDADSPSLEGPYSGMTSRDRIPADRRPPPMDAMQIDSPSVSQSDRRGYGQLNSMCARANGRRSEIVHSFASVCAMIVRDVCDRKQIHFCLQTC